MTILLCQPVPPLIGKSPAIEALRSVAGRVADTDLPILIRGEMGGGREDPRPDGPRPQPPRQGAVRSSSS